MSNVHLVRRCAWAGDDSLMTAYHDKEWGVHERDSRALWEMLMLEGFHRGHHRRRRNLLQHGGAR
jgi:DNA-3-methyladenine glycosylase I